MNDYKELDNLVFNFSANIKDFVQEYGGTMPPVIKTQLQELMYTKFSKEVDAITQRELLEIKNSKKFYNKMLRAKSKLASVERADVWFEKVFQKYYNKGLLEHLIVKAILYLHKQELFVPKRLFAKINNDELLAQFTIAACEYLGWTGQNGAAEQLTTEENETTDERTNETETANDGAEQPQDEAESAEVTVYEPKEVQPVEQSAQPVVKVERTVTHEVMTATPQGQSQNVDVGADVAEEQTSPLQSEEKVPPHFYRPGGKSGKKE